MSGCAIGPARESEGCPRRHQMENIKPAHLSITPIRPLPGNSINLGEMNVLYHLKPGKKSTRASVRGGDKVHSRGGGELVPRVPIPFKKNGMWRMHRHTHMTRKEKKFCVYYKVCTKRALVLAGFACWNTSHYSYELSFTGLERGLRTGEKTASCPPKASVEAWRKLSARALCPSVSAREICSNASVLCECVNDAHQSAPCV